MADPDAYTLDSWMSYVSTLLWIPAILTVGRVARAGAGTLGPSGVFGWLFMFGLVGLILALAAWAVMVISFAGCGWALLRVS